jgi:hypothetical protein
VATWGTTVQSRRHKLANWHRACGSDVRVSLKMEIGRRNERRDIQSIYKCVVVRDFNDPLKICTGLNHHVILVSIRLFENVHQSGRRIAQSIFLNNPITAEEVRQK